MAARHEKPRNHRLQTAWPRIAQEAGVKEEIRVPTERGVVRPNRQAAASLVEGNKCLQQHLVFRQGRIMLALPSCVGDYERDARCQKRCQHLLKWRCIYMIQKCLKTWQLSLEKRKRRGCFSADRGKHIITDVENLKPAAACQLVPW